MSIPSIRRNPVISNCFEILGLMEKSGSGFKKIDECYNDFKNKKRELLSTKDFFQ